MPPHDPSVAAEQARARLHEEIERVRVGVEEMLTEQGSDDADLRRELDALREDTRLYVKKRVGKVEKRMDKRAGQARAPHRPGRAGPPARRAGACSTNAEAMLDGLLREVRAIADLLARTR